MGFVGLALAVSYNVNLHLRLASGVAPIQMHNVQVLLHVKTVRAAVAVDLVTAVVHREAHQRIVVFPVVADKVSQNTEGVAVCAQLSQRLGTFGAVLVHYGIVISVVNN